MGTGIQSGAGRLEFHTHPHNDDCMPSKPDMDLMKVLRQSTGQRESTIVTPNGRTSIFNEFGIISTGTVENLIDAEAKEVYYKLFGGK